jgi:hypothetical protein
MMFQKKTAGIVDVDMDGLDKVCAAIERQNRRMYKSAKKSICSLSSSTIKIASIPVIHKIQWHTCIYLTIRLGCWYACRLTMLVSWRCRKVDDVDDVDDVGNDCDQ